MMNNVAQRARKFQIMKERSHPREPYDHYHEAHLTQSRRLADRQHLHMQTNTLELLVESRRQSTALEGLLKAFAAKAEP